MQLLIIRHGKPKVINNRFYEAHLSDDGERQARQLASSGLPKPELVFSSPYNRAIDTAKAITDVFRVSFAVEDFLKEWKLQSLNLLDPDYTSETEKGWADHSLRVKGDESLAELKERAYAGTMHILSENQTAKTIHFVSHGTVIDMLCCKVGGRLPALSDIEKMKFLDYAVFEYEEGKLKLVKDVLD